MLFAKSEKGFTLIELMIVVAIIAIIAAIAIPSFLRAKINANEGTAIASLKGIVTFEVMFRSAANVDANANGTGEYGTLGEISGAYLRTETIANAPGLLQPFCPTSLQPRANGFGQKTGYLFTIFLPTNGASPTTDADNTSATAAADPQDAILQESRFRAYAWPSVFNNTGLKCFSVNQVGEVLIAPNIDATGNALYSGTVSPAFNAAVSTSAGAPAEVGAQFTGSFISGTAAVDTQIWTSAGG